jgi:DNA helicase-2/ATP-dependent DNA helicase PcrA
MPHLTAAQVEAIQHPAPRLQVLACAGSGKTEVLARRAARLLREGIAPEGLIAFTFTEKAAAELKARIEARAAESDSRFRELPPVARGMFIGTCHGWAFRSLSSLGAPYEAMDPLTEEQEWALLHRVAYRLGIVDLHRQVAGEGKASASEAVTAFLRSVEVVYNERLDREAVRRGSPAFAQALARYEWLLDEMRLMPYRTMVDRAAHELAPGGRLRQRLQGRLAHVLVDEFQDFNRAQDELLSRLAELGAAITVVGDDDQAIYQWRGGDLSLFVGFPKRYRGTAVVPLAENHRCRPHIVRFARQLVDGLPDRLPKVLASAREEMAPGAVEVFVAETPVEEAYLIAQRIEELLRRGHPPADIAVLFRSVRTSAAPLVQELRQRGIPVAVVGKTSLLARPEMALIARIFVYWAGGTWYPNPDYQPEAVSRESLLEEIRQVAHLSQGQAMTALDRLERLGQQVKREGVRDIVALFNDILAVLGLPVAGEEGRRQELGLGALSELLTAFDHSTQRATPAQLYRDQQGTCAQEAEEDAALAADTVPTMVERRLERTRGEIYLVRLRAFLEHFAGRAAEETPDTLPEAQDSVQVMTVHQAKGLEFAVAFVPCLVDGRFPSSLTGRRQLWYVPQELFDVRRYEGREEDEARLLYVAFTRARDLLALSWFRTYAARPARPSRFLQAQLRPVLARALSWGQASAPQRRGDQQREALVDLDFSSLVTYLECRYRYWLQHVCGFQPLRAQELGFGRLLHHVVAEMARLALAGRLPSEEDADRALARSFYLPFAGPVPAARLRESARERLRAYVRNYGPELARTLQAEAAFEVPLAGARVRGRIDLLLRAADGGPHRVELVDFKTSSDRPPSELHQNQLRLYALVAQRQGLKAVRLFIHDLDAATGSRLEVDPNPAKALAFQEQLEDWVRGIREGDFPPVAEETTCRRCDFRRFCRYAPPAAATASPP